MKKAKKIILYIIISVVVVLSLVIMAIPTRIQFSTIKDHLLISEDNEHIYVGLDFYASEIDHMASKNGHIYLYSLEDGSRCYAQYLYCKASLFDRTKEDYTALYYYPLTNNGAEHGVAIDIRSDGTQVEYKCYTVAVFYSDSNGDTHLLWNSHNYDPGKIK